MLTLKGEDTTATTITATFFYLSRNPRCYATLTSKIRSTFSSATDTRLDQLLSNCTYLRAVVDEAIRMWPPISGTLWRELPVGDKESEKPLIVEGHVVPAGT